MARIRHIKPTIWQDEKLGRVEIPARLLFIGLISNADDDGRLRAAPPLVRSMVFPYDDVTLADVDRWLLQLHEERLIDLYGTFSGQRYCRVVSWARHQKFSKYRESELPPPSSHNPVLKRLGEQESISLLPTTPVAAPSEGQPVTETKRNEGLSGSVSPSLRSVDPSPSPTVAGQPVPAEKVRKVFDAWCQLFSRNSNTKLDEKRRARIRWALKEYDDATVWRVLKGYAADPWRHEATSRNEIRTLLKDAASIERGLELFEQKCVVRPAGSGGAKVLTEKALREAGY